ncbi:MAG TPA: ubiquinol oxidase subunit II [Steroidobacteraceae bacterium]|nr:ubiquinol oxidase subunit II [Steroidobacteraceae bacterium]
MTRFGRRAGLSSAAVLALAVATGCEHGVLNPAGPVSHAERLILFNALAIMLAIVVPTIVCILAFAWWYRAKNTRATYAPQWAYSGRLELLVWSIPALVVLFLSGIAWTGSHELDPAKPLRPEVEPLEVEVVALDWKWLFIYPEQRIASINQLVTPVGRPVHFRLTASSVMNVFFIPQLGSEIYAMNGMVTQLNLAADRAGTFPGIAAHFNGDGFSDMTFDTEAVTADEFSRWMTSAQAQGPVLDEATYRGLLKQSAKVPPHTYRDVTPGLFDHIASQHLPPGDGPQEE